MERRKQNKAKVKIIAPSCSEHEMDGNFQSEVFYPNLGVHEVSKHEDRSADKEARFEFGNRTSQYDPLRDRIWYQPH